MGLSFIIAIYSLLIAVFIGFALIMQTYLNYKGLTLSDWKRAKYNNNRKSIWLLPILNL